MANTNAPATSHTQPPPPAGAQSQLGPFARFQRWLKQSDTLEERLFGLIRCPSYPSPHECGHCVLSCMAGLFVYTVFIIVISTYDENRNPERIQMFLAHPWEHTGAPIVELIELGIRAVASVLLYILLIPLAPLLWCAGVALFLYILYIYFLVPFFLILTLYSWGYLTIKIPYLPPRFQRVIDALLLPHAAWSLAQLAMPNLVRPIATGVDLWLKYLAVTALFDVHVLPRLLNTAVELERCLQKTQES
ncbi:hypothetical protein NBRC10513_007707 [Rhodotorula toruloides]